MAVSDQEEDYKESLQFLKEKLAEPKEKREQWLNGIVDKWVARRHQKSAKKGKKPLRKKWIYSPLSQSNTEEVCKLLSELEPIMLRRVVSASRRSPETLPDELLLLESVIVLRKELCGGTSTWFESMKI